MFSQQRCKSRVVIMARGDIEVFAVPVSFFILGNILLKFGTSRRLHTQSDAKYRPLASL